MSNIKDLTVAQLKRAIEIREQIESLQDELASLGNGSISGVGRRGKRRMSAAGRARIAAAAKARWAKYRSGKGKAKPAGKSKRFNAAARAKLSAAARARWAKAKASGKSSL